MRSGSISTCRKAVVGVARRSRKPRDGLIPFDCRISNDLILLMIDHNSAIGRVIC